MKALFINADASKPQCAIYQAGIQYGGAFKLCERLDVSYMAIQPGANLPDPASWDIVIFNYQHVSAGIIPPEYFSYCKLAIGFLYEARLVPGESPMHFGDQTCDQLFDIIISPDPTLEAWATVWSTPRVVSRSPVYTASHIPPYIGTFGFPSPWKALDDVVRMMNDEFSQAVFRLNFAPASHQDGTGLQEMMEQYASDLLAIAKPGIEIRFSSEYMDENKLVKWLAENSVNVFLAKEQRSIETGGALLASTDMAIAARKPIMVSKSLEARHLGGCSVETLHDAIQNTGGYVQELYDTWTPRAFARRIDELVEMYL